MESEQARESVIPNNALPFSGGLVYQGLQRIGVHDLMLLLRLRVAAIFVLPLLAWLPLFILSTIDGKLLPGSVGTSPFCSTCCLAHIRLLVALLAALRPGSEDRRSAHSAGRAAVSPHGGSFPKRRFPGSKPRLRVGVQAQGFHPRSIC